MVKFEGIVKGLKVEEYSGDELEELGNRLCRQLFLHIGMIKYKSSGLKTFDLTVRNLSELTDEASTLVLGVDVIKGTKEYGERLMLFIGLVGELESTDLVTSVRRDLRNSFMNEIRGFISQSNNITGYWN